MNESQNNSKQKWIALAVIILFALSGGVYKIAKNRGSKSPDQGGNQTADNTSKNGAVIGSTATASKDASNKDSAKGASGVSRTESAGGGTQVSMTTPGTVTPGIGLPGAGLAGAPGAPAQGTAAPVEPQDQCVTITYHHKPTPTHTDEESCSHHKNMLTLAKFGDTHINAPSVCVRVNGTPVHYLTVKGHSDELIFGSVAGPKSKVTVRYCTGKAQGCVKEDCTVPKDEFMEAIGGGEGGTQDAKLGQWDPTAPAEKEADVMAKLDGEVKKELETNDDLNGRAPAGEMFKGWIGERKPPLADPPKPRIETVITKTKGV